MNSVLILGGCGFIGLTLARCLVELGHKVVLVDNLSPQIHGEVPTVQLPQQVELLRFDIRELSERWQIVDKSDVIFHLAAETGTAQSMYRIAHYVSVNDLGTASLLEALAKCTRRARRVVLASSRSVYGEGAYMRVESPGVLLQPPSRRRGQLLSAQWEILDGDGCALTPVATPETLGFAPGSIYAATKANQELLLKSASEALDFTCLVLRLQNVYGEGQSLQNPYTGIISIFFNRARQGLRIDLFEDGLESRDFVHVDDVTQAMVAAMHSSMPNGSTINVGSGLPTSVATLASELCAAADLNVPIQVTGEFRVGDIRHCFADLRLAKRLLGYEPQVSLSEGLKRFVSWAASQPVHSDRSAIAAAELRDRNLSN